LNSSSNVQIWSVMPAAIAGVLCFQRLTPSSISIFNASCGLTKLNHAKKKHRCAINIWKHFEKLIVSRISLHTPFLTVRLFLAALLLD
jgi:hypothetical protein